MNPDYKQHEQHEQHEKRGTGIHEIGGCRKDDPDTSLEAAESIDVRGLEDIVFHCIRLYRTGLPIHKEGGKPGLTVEEISIKLALYIPTSSPRLAPLCRKGYVVDTGERRVASSGRRRIVWDLSPREKSRWEVE